MSSRRSRGGQDKGAVVKFCTYLPMYQPYLKAHALPDEREEWKTSCHWWTSDPDMKEKAVGHNTELEVPLFFLGRTETGDDSYINTLGYRSHIFSQFISMFPKLLYKTADLDKLQWVESYTNNMIGRDGVSNWYVTGLTVTPIAQMPADSEISTPYLLIEIQCVGDALFRYAIGGTDCEDPRRDKNLRWSYENQETVFHKSFKEFLAKSRTRCPHLKFLQRYPNLEQWQDPNMFGTFKDGFLLEYLMRVPLRQTTKNAMRRIERKREHWKFNSRIPAELIEFFISDHPALIDAIRRVQYASKIAEGSGYNFSVYKWSTCNPCIDSIYSKEFVTKVKEKAPGSHSYTPVGVRADLAADLCKDLYEVIYGRQPRLEELSPGWRGDEEYQPRLL